MEIVAVDIGGTHARFAIATLGEGGSITLGPETVLETSDYAGLAEAWTAFGAVAGRPLPARAGIAVAAAIEGTAIKLTNNSWILRPGQLAAALGVSATTLVNDFAAVAYAISACDDQLQHLCGLTGPLPRDGVVSVVGPGTGLGVAILRRRAEGDEVIATEGGHIGFAPSDEIDERILARFRARVGRVSAERVVSGSGLPDIYAAVTGTEPSCDERALWQQALAGEDMRAMAARDRFCGLLGSVAGDLALAQGAQAVVIAGGLGLRLAPHLPGSSFAERFSAKGRFRARMERMPVKIIAHPQPGLLGAAAAFAAEHAQ